MPRRKQPWFRFYVEAMHDRKLRRLPVAHRWLWVAVLAASRQSPEPGTLLVTESEPTTYDDLADIAALPVTQVRSGVAAFIAAGMLTEVDGVWTVPKWSERQFQSDDVTERTTQHRSREQRRNVPTSTPGTSSSRERATETETESEEKTPLGPPDVFTGGLPTRATDDKTLTACIAEFASQQGSPIPKAADRTADYRAVLRFVAEHLGGKHPSLRRLQTQVIADFVADVDAPLSPQERDHTSRLVGLRGAEAALQLVSDAVAAGAGLEPEHRGKRIRYAAAIGREAS